MRSCARASASSAPRRSPSTATLVGVFDVVTAADARGNGYATLACASLLSWAWQHGASVAYLQVTADNAPAIAAYRKFGFATAYTYHYRGRPGECE